MLSFFTSKPFLVDLLTENYVDIHSHVLPGIDDGAKNIADTIKLTTAFQEIGFSQFITTPHISEHIWKNASDAIITNQKETEALLGANNITLPFKAAAEYLIDEHFENLFKSEKLLTLKDNYVLVEMSFMNAPVELYRILFELQVAGYIPVLAHPERYLFCHRSFEEYAKLKKAGCLFQLNLLAVTGHYGSTIAGIAEKLLKLGMYDFTGTDVHHKIHIERLNQKITVSSISALKTSIANNQFFKF